MKNAQQRQNHGWQRAGQLRAVNAATLTLIMTLGASADARAGLFGFGGDTWQEEVLLHDGRKIIVRRSQTYGGSREPGQSGPIKEHSVRFTLPGSGQPITWTSEYSGDIGRANFQLLAVHAVNGTPYIVASPNLCLSYNKWGRPNPPYVLFKRDGHEWRRISLQALPVEFKTVNVVLSIQKHQVQELSASGVTFAQTIADVNRRSEILEFRSILREPLAKERVSEKCMEMVFYKGSWVGPGDSIGKRMMDSK